MELRLKKQEKTDEAAAEKPARAQRSNNENKGAKSAKVSMKGGRRFVLIIGDEGAILILMQGVKVIRRLFAPSAQASHSEAMIEIMKMNPGAPVSILADVIDQQYVPHSFPPVSSLSVGGLVKRRLDRDFQPEDLKGSLSLGRDKAGRKEWKYLLIALTKTPLMSEWINVLVELPNELKGIYLVPVEAVNYVALLNKKFGNDKPRPWQLLISHNKISGFRQVVMHDGKLIFTRVSQAIDDAIPAVIAGNIEQEIINTVEYLKRLEFSDSANLDATVIISHDVISSLDLKRFGFGYAEAFTPLQIAEGLGLEQAALSADRFGDVVMAAGFAVNKKHVLRFSNAYIEKLNKLYFAQIGIRGFAALCVLALLGLSVLTVATIVGDYGAIGDAERKVNQMKPDLLKTQASVNGLNNDVAFKSAVVATYDAYVKNAMKPEDFVAAIAPFITQRQRITEFKWEWNDKPVAAGAAAPALPLTVTLNVDFSGGGNTLDVVDKAATDMLDAMKTQLSQYEVTAEPFPWQKIETPTEGVALELSSPNSKVVPNAIGIITLKGVKKGDAAASSPTPTMPLGAP
jgi:hypothetical protein